MFFKHINKKEKKTEMMPMQETNSDGIHIQVIRIEHRPFYDSVWRVTVNVTDQQTGRTDNYSTKITRDETQTAEELEKIIRAFGKEITFDKITSLDERNNIYYD